MLTIWSEFPMCYKPGAYFLYILFFRYFYVLAAYHNHLSLHDSTLLSLSLPLSFWKQYIP